MIKILLTIAVLCYPLVFQIASADVINDAITNSNRPEADVANDPGRKPAQVLKFFQIEPGMSVFDIFAGGGYYSELLSYVVGPAGSVVLYNNNPWNQFVMKSVDTRLLNNRLPNVTRNTATPESLVDIDGQYDAAIFILGMHDTYYSNPEDGWVAIDKEKFLEGIYGLLKTGGILGVIDHNGSPVDHVNVAKNLHRIDPGIVIKDLEAVGFKLEATSDILGNENDDYSESVFLPQHRWQTDRSVLRFRK